MNRAERFAAEGDDKRRQNVGFALQILQRRLASSSAAIHESLRRRRERLEGRLAEERLGKRGREARLAAEAALPAWSADDEAEIEDVPAAEAEATEEAILDRATAARTIAELETEIETLRRLEARARALRRAGNDAKWTELNGILDHPLMTDDAGHRRKLIVFTEPRDTLNYTAERIRSRLGRDEALVVIHGGVRREERRKAVEAFTHDKDVLVLVANDAAGEGINLQRAHLMVNYDLPWNPNRLEQRFGRIHRIGQTEVCRCWNLVAADTLEGAVYSRLLEKIEVAREALGGRVYDVLGQLFEAKALGDARRHGADADFRGVHVCPAESADVPDEQRVRLVVLRPNATHKRGSVESAALSASADVLENRGTAPRQHRNMLVFLAADEEAMDGLSQEVRRFLAWQSVDRDKDALNLDANQRKEASDGKGTSDRNVGVRFAEAWRWLLVPTQPVRDGNVGELEWEAIQADGDDTSIIARAARRLRANDTIIPKWSPALLKMELDRWFWNDRDHASVKTVCDALTAYCYLPRLLDEAVFVEAVRAGVASGDYFGFATSVSDEGRYEGLVIGEVATVHLDAASVLVKPDVARKQQAAETPEPYSPPGVEDEKGRYDAGKRKETQPPVSPKLPRRFFGTVAISPDRAGRDMGDVAEEVLQNLTTLPRAKVRVTVEIEAEFPEGATPDTQRVVDENCRALRFETHGFEES